MVLGIFLIASLQATTLTNCVPVGNGTNCFSSTTLAPSAPYGPSPADRLLQEMRENQEKIGHAYQRSRQSSAVAAAQNVDTSAAASQARRSEAYLQVGKLISEGKCADANRLAQFYGRDDIIADTAKACQR